MLCSATSDLGLLCLPITLLGVSRLQWIKQILTLKFNKRTDEQKQTLTALNCSQDKYLGPVVQSVVSLTSSLRVISLTVLADSIHDILIFFAEKM